LESPLSVNRARSSTKRSIPVAEAKAKVIAAIRDGVQVETAMALVQRTGETYKSWRKEDAAFREQIDAVREIARAARTRAKGDRVEVPDFPEFCAEYLGMPLPEHHLRVWDVMHGREPRNMHPAIRHQLGRPDRLLLNFAPFHSKTQVWSVQYALWRMLKDANVRIAVVSKTQQLAKKIVGQIKSYLTMPQYAKLHAAFMPEGGWAGSSWTRTEIFLSGVDVAQKDPTLQALGLGGQIYGSRLDLILLDDLVDMKNTHTYKELADWVGTEVDSRVDDNGILAVLGTRLGAHDLYSELRDLLDWDGETPVWTYFAQPAVLEMPVPADPSTWVTLWPFKPQDGTPMWDGPSLAKKKAVLPSEARWQLTYQQMDASIDQVFPTGAVMASIDHRRAAGPMEGLYTVLGVDPAANGYTAMTVMGLDRATGRRYVLDGFCQAKCPPDLFMAKMRNFISTHGCREVVVESNAVQGFISRSQAFKDYCYTNGCLIREHMTGGNKWDEDMGVASMAPWFLGCAEHDVENDTWTRRPTEFHPISLPNPKFAGGWLEMLTTQLTTWQPKERQRSQSTPTDMVMSCWFASLGIQRAIDQGRNVPRHIANPFATRGDRKDRVVVNLQEAIEQKLRGQAEVSFATGLPTA
jgi:hypothetical protein